MSKVKSKPVSISPTVAKRLRKRPYYAFLYATNIIKGRLPEKLEELFATDPESAYKYAKYIIKGKLPDFVHNALIINCFDKNESKQFVSMYLAEFCKEEVKCK